MSRRHKIKEPARYPMQAQELQGLLQDSRVTDDEVRNWLGWSEKDYNNYVGGHKEMVQQHYHQLMGYLAIKANLQADTATPIPVNKKAFMLA